MKYNKDKKKFTYEMKMPGDAWMGHVDQHHNGAAINPLRVEGSNGKWGAQVQKMIDEFKQQDQLQKNADRKKEADKSLNQQMPKDVDRER